MSLTQEEKKEAIKNALKELKIFYRNDREKLARINLKAKEDSKLSIDEQYNKYIDSVYNSLPKMARLVLNKNRVEEAFEKEVKEKNNSG